MVVAVPVKTDKENSAVAPLFGKAKWFAFIKDGEVSIERNSAEGGREVVAWLLEKGVTDLIIQHMSHPPYELLKESGSVSLFHSGEERIELETLLQKFQAGELRVIDESNEKEIIKQHNRQHQHHG